MEICKTESNQRLVFADHLPELFFAVSSQKFSILLGKLFGINGFAVFQHHMGRFYERKMTLKNRSCIIQAHKDDGAAGFLCHLKTSLLEGEEFPFIIALIPGAFRENAHGNAAFDLVNPRKDGF